MSGNPTGSPYLASRPMAPPRGDGLADVLERVLDKGLVIAGDIQLNLLDIEVLTIKVRLLLASADTAQQMGIDWWKDDPFLSSGAKGERGEIEDLEERNRALIAASVELDERLQRLEAMLGAGQGNGHAEADGDGEAEPADADEDTEE